ncbi:N-terminal Xaa-Pro-Lys N-methyltransferase 1-like [Sycon ciliatum]|uniref:N-terminal Xaa-Pro-Lys N-methyltransferase 1-like n=1 Tax=Sycon ciliatum TaxID=27933 RepID=UPI0020A8770C|eukprot:scpid62755/ scgid10645/ Alpha N-terminal protein methyltransferase 1A; Methyltransferase-like protein 11A; X-Pro-Lys N-terminal protein methyltransferase 1A
MASPEEDIDAKINYSHADEYWKGQPATVDGMLGGFGSISRKDVEASKALLKTYYKPSGTRANGRALDCGAGIGRVSKLLLMPLFDKVDMVEQNGEFLERSFTYMGDKAANVGERFCSGLQDFTPAAGRYNLIWIQWVIIYLTDDDFVNFLKRCKAGLTKDGLIAIKDNVTRGERDYDEQDSSSTRTMDEMKAIFSKAGLTLMTKKKQTDFPPDLHPVIMFVLH